MGILVYPAAANSFAAASTVVNTKDSVNFLNDFERNITALHYIEVLEYSPKSDNFIFRRGLGPFTECLQIHLVLLDGEGCPNQISHLIC